MWRVRKLHLKHFREITSEVVQFDLHSEAVLLAQYEIFAHKKAAFTFQCTSKYGFRTVLVYFNDFVSSSAAID